MNKYIPAEKLIAEIKRLDKENKELLKSGGSIGREFLFGTGAGYADVIKIIDSLQQEQPDVDLDVEIANYLNKNVLNRINNADIIEDFTTMEAGELASHFYELGINARKEE